VYKRQAQDSAKQIRLGAKEYADELLQEVEQYLEQQLNIVKQNRQELNVAKR